ncbi:hypothetical protein PanWU01x14_247530, partial [Parasponia andersonii]
MSKTEVKRRVSGRKTLLEAEFSWGYCDFVGSRNETGLMALALSLANLRCGPMCGP